MATAKKNHDWSRTSLVCYLLAIGFGVKKQGGGDWQTSDFHPLAAASADDLGDVQYEDLSLLGGLLGS